MIATYTALEELAESARLYGRIRRSIDTYTALPKLDGCDVKPALDNLRKKLIVMQEAAEPLVGRSEVINGIQALLKDLHDLQLMNGKDVAGTVTSPDPSRRSVGMSKFNRLPCIALPNFDGTAIGWRPFGRSSRMPFPRMSVSLTWTDSHS